MAYTDRQITCVECGASFVFSAQEQEQFAQRGYTNEPKRCVNCRQARRSRMSVGGGGGGGYGGRGGTGGGGGHRESFTATCAECGREASLPFRPRGDRPVYCSDCFRRRSGR